MNTKLTKIISGLFVATAAFQTASAGNITDIKVSSLPNKQKIVKVSFDKEIVNPTGFVTSSPARIALDFEQTGISMDQQVLEYADPLLSKISAAQNSSRARLVLNLNKPGQYNTEVRGNKVWIFINESDDTVSAPARPAVKAAPAAPAKQQAAAPSTKSAVSVSEPFTPAKQQAAAPFTESVVSVSAPFSPAKQQAAASAKQQAAAPAKQQAAAPAKQQAAAPAKQQAAAPAKQTNIDFRKDGKNAGIIELAALGFAGQPDISQQHDHIIVTLKNHTLPTTLQRSLDVADFKTPVQKVTLKRLNNDTQLIITTAGNWELVNKSAAPGYFTFQVLPKKQNLESGGVNNAPKTFTGRKISLDFQDVEIRTILQILAKESGMNIVASDSVNGKMTLSLKDVPWDQALDLVMQARNLDMRQQGNIVNIAPRDELLAKDKALLQAEKDIADLGALYSQNFQLKYKNVEEFRSILRLDNADTTGNRNTLISGRGSVLIDPATNTLIVTDTRSVIEKFRKLIDELDVPAQQVMIEARIVEAADGFSRDLGVKFGATGKKKLKNDTSAFGWGVNSGFGGDDKWGAETKINLPITAAANSISLVRAISSGALNLELSASESLSKTKTLANPRVLTQNRKEAKIESGYEIPFTVTSIANGGSSTNTELKKAVLGLTVTPNITPDGQIIMTVKINKDSPAQCASGNQTILCISTKNLNTQAMVENGGTLIVGGIYEEDNGNTLTKVPLLGDIPVIGNLFKTRGKKTDRRELLIFITPRIMGTAGNSLRY
ncbi:type IV pilus secretin PilQ [Neisseria meningitidis]|uniref:Type IV pilus biogenesis and competence protein PilQ n=1 Tax=Neisseria meningitidis serogroup B / serotype 15 (strain H44/76) TaxID=909420 RepID=PILQ_NEIMH|nr:type IV pilus secretin PilQ [Neisseria meningitidis]Q9ZHF3.2 RecName: Full=Type IV pilus biogenesis and competence protein PilQ; Flags: Precursor [Neisseria meningitidis H44/76]ADY96329.1 type IV pilus secretin PilQ [Neisseria meningitidis H44/76]EFV63384.1 type IV pilus secretin PilQ family protein [Neisseria meningitidis H44/76]MCL4990398.1 type IV pilus secretin PilQ [Neisseria meningitidis]MCL5684404.1 type IV pilus secretin PilQ [Neisseria meningitidis]MCL5688300.1 type IV pilus secre